MLSSWMNKELVSYNIKADGIGMGRKPDSENIHKWLQTGMTLSLSGIDFTHSLFNANTPNEAHAPRPLSPHNN